MGSTLWPRLENTYLLKNGPPAPEHLATAEATALYMSLLSPLAVRLRFRFRFILLTSLEEMAQLAWLIHFLVRKVSVTLTISGRPAASTLCVWLDSLTIEKDRWQVPML